MPTFMHPKEELGRVAAANLLKIISHDAYETAVRFPPRLVERESVRALE